MKDKKMTLYRIEAKHGTEPLHATLSRLGLAPCASYILRERSVDAAIRRAAKTLQRDPVSLYVSWAGER